jgi:hypothetical protein
MLAAAKRLAASMDDRALEISAYAFGEEHTARELRRSFAARKGDPPVAPSFAFEIEQERRAALGLDDDDA